MFKRLLVPLDGSQLAESILPVAQTFARTLDADVTLLHVVEPAPPTNVHGEPHLLNADQARDYLARIAADLSAQGLRVETHVDTAHAGTVDAIFLHGGELNADLIALTSHGRSGLRQAVYGSIAQRVLRRGEIPVLILRAEQTAPQAEYNCEKILVPLDSTPMYEPAFDAAVELARAFHAVLELVMVVPTTETLSPERAAAGTFLPGTTRAVLDLAQEDGAKYLGAKLAFLAAQNMPARAQVLRGAIPAQILATAQQSHAQLLVLATHGRTGLDAFWSGSVAPQVVTRADAPILLLRVKGEEPLR